MVNNKPKIVHISTSASGGAGRAAYRIHEALLKSGVNSSFVSLDTIQVENIRQVKSPNTNQGFFEILRSKIDFRLRKHLGIDFNKERWIRTEHKRIGQSLKKTTEISSLPFSDFNILNIPGVNNADIIHLHWIAEFLDYPSFFKFNNKPVVWTLHDMNSFQGLFHYKDDEIRNKQIAGRLDKSVRSFKRRLIKNRRASLAIVTPSKWLLKAAERINFFLKAQTSCISYPLNTSIFYPLMDDEFKVINHIPEKNTILLFVAQRASNRRKGFDLLIKALKDNTSESITLMVLGNGDNINTEGVDTRFLGVIKNSAELSYYYSNADAFLLPSREDNLPNVMLESLACGTPVIGFATGGLKEHIIDYKTGLLAKDVNSISLAETINEFCRKKNDFDRAEIRKYAVDTFDEKKVAEEYKLVYADVLKGQQSNA